MQKSDTVLRMQAGVICSSDVGVRQVVAVGLSVFSFVENIFL